MLNSTIIGSRPNIKIHPNLYNLNFSKKQNKDYSDGEEIYGVNFFADTSGCGFYRLVWPSMLLSNKNYTILNLNKAIPDIRWFRNNKFIKIQRQVSREHLQYVKILRQFCDELQIPLIYEIDDVPFYEDIPEYNQNRKSFSKPELYNSVREIMNLCDEIVTTTPYFKDHLKEKLNKKEVTVVPNFVPEFWMGRYYDENDVKRKFNKHRKKPRIVYPGSGAHFSLDMNAKDDFTALVELVKKTVNEFQWVFYGGFPRALSEYYHSGKIEYHPWVSTMDAPRKLFSLEPTVIIAPLVDNVFNRCKSNIKFTEASSFGIPCVCQNMITYFDALNKFDTPDDLYQQIRRITKDQAVYMKESRKAFMKVKNNFMEDKINIWDESLRYRFGSEKRINLNKLQQY